MNRTDSAAKATAFFDDLWRQGDPWQLETSDFERAKYAAQLALLDGNVPARALEIGCGAGVFTQALAQRAAAVVALDVSALAIERARTRSAAPNIDYRVANAMEWDAEAEGPWDLVVLAETVCYLGWLYSFFDVAWLARSLYAATRPGGRLLLTNTCGGVDDYLLMPSIIRSYRDVFVNAGFAVVSESIWRGVKNDADIEVLITLAERPL